MNRSAWTKQIIDTHVSNSLKQVKDEKDRKLRGFQFARMYYEVKEYEIAKRYLMGFLSVKDNSAPAYKLLGQILESLNQMPQSIDAYKKCLDLDSQNNDVLLKICSAYSGPINVSPDVARFWAEKAERIYPGNEVVFKLKMKSRDADGTGTSPNDILDLLISEADKYPWDVIRQTRLMGQYKAAGRINEAYERAMKFDVASHPAYSRSIEWQLCVCEILTEYASQPEANVDIEFHQYYLSMLNDLILLSLEKSSVIEVVGILWTFDQALLKIQNLNVSRDDWKVFRSEMEAQYFFHCGTVLLNKALKDRLSWRDSSELAAACNMASFSTPPFSNKSSWFVRAKENEKRTYIEWHRVANFRCSQTGHMLTNLVSGSSERSWLEKIKSDFCNKQGKDRLFQVLFTLPQQRNCFESSYLARNTLFEKFNLRFPDSTKLKEIDIVAQELRPDSLHHAVWICLQYCTAKFKAQPNYGLPLFSDLPYEAKNLDVVGPESVKQLDVEAFLYAVVRSEALKQEEKLPLFDKYRPALLPTAINDILCTADQQLWWNSVYKLTVKSAREPLGQSWAVLQRGLETIRGVDNNGLDVDMLVHLARTFSDRADETESLKQKPEDLIHEVSCLQARASHYWKKALAKLEQLKKKHSNRQPKYFLFENRDEKLDENDIAAYFNEGTLYLAYEAKNKGSFDEALRLLNQIQTAEASFETALIYKLLATGHLSEHVDCGDSERENHVILLTKARDALYSTLDRLRGNRLHELNGRVTDEMDLIEHCLMSLQVDNEIGDEPTMSSVSMSRLITPDRRRIVRTPDRRQQLSVTNGLESGGHIAQSTPQLRKSSSSPSNSSQRCRPSPDRLDAEMRSMRFVQDNLLRILSEDQKSIRNSVEHVQVVVQQSADRLTSIESKLAVVLEFQRQMTLNSLQTQPSQTPNRPLLQQPIATLPPRAGLVQPTYPGMQFSGDVASYDFMSAVQSYDAAMCYGTGVQPSQSTTGYPAFPSNVGPSTHGYVVPLADIDRQADQYSYGEQYSYNDDDYQENALGYEIPDVAGLPQLASHGVFMSGGESTARPTPIMPGFFANQVKQKLDEKFAVPAVTSTPTLQPAVSDVAVSDVNVPETKLAAGGMSSSSGTKPVTSVGSILSPPKFVTASQPSSATSQPPTTTSKAETGSLVSMPATIVASSQPAFSSIFTSTTAPIVASSQPVTTTAPVKAVFGGFSFVSTPVVSEHKIETKDSKKPGPDKETEKAANPFAGFSFNQSLTSSADKKEPAPTSAFSGFKFISPTKPAAKSDGKEQPVAPPCTSKSQPVFGETSTVGTPSFAALAAQTGSAKPQTFVTKNEGSGAFQGVGQPVFKSSVVSPTARGTADSSGKDDEDVVGDDYVPDQEFRPLVSLPEVEVKTGEEDEVKLFGERAKLYRMDPDNKAWKERGIGEIKILQHKVTGKCRIVMRREQVLKLCANHLISAGMKLVPMTTSETSLCWVANDYSEGECVKEQLCVKFKTIEIVQKFKSCFENCQTVSSKSPEKENINKVVGDSKQGQVAVPEKKSSADVKEAGSTDTPASLSSLFQAKAGQWDCNACYVRNNPDKGSCVACGSPNPVSKPASMSSLSQSSTAPVAKSVESTPLSTLFQAKAGQWDCTGCYIRNDSEKVKCVACDTPKPGCNPVSSTPSVPQSTGVPSTDTSFKISATGGFTFSGVKFSGFGSSSATTPVAKPSAASEPAAVTKPLFTTPATAATPLSSSTPSFSSPFSFKPLQQQAISTPSAATSLANKAATPSAPVFKFGSASSTMPTSLSTPSFAQLADTSATKQGSANILTSSAKDGFGSQSFVFKGVTSGSVNDLAVLRSPMPLQSVSTPSKSSQVPASPGSPDGNELYVTGADDEPNVTFEPVCTLPDNVEVKTGEEDEDVLYEHRAKLFRFADNEWKERGIGDVKLLQHRETGVIRIMMRRERVLKICLNHRVVSTINLQSMPSAQGKAWMWYAADFADGPEPKTEQFSLRFKTEDIANDFKKAFDEAKSQVSQAGSNSQLKKSPQCPGPSILANLLTLTSKGTAPDSSCDQKPTEHASDEDNNECLITDVKMPPSDLIQRADQYQLPKSFFNYITKQDCPGCIGCRSDEFEFTYAQLDKGSTPVLKPPAFEPAKSSIPVSTSLNPSQTPIFGASRSLFGALATKVSTPQSSLFGNNAQPVFGGTVPASSQNSAVQPLFGSASSVKSQPVFGGASTLSSQPLFGGASTLKSQSVFGSASSVNSQPVFGSASSVNSQPVFGAAAKVTDNNTPTTSSSMFGMTAKSIGFSDLAAATSTFGSNSGASTFSWSGSGTPLFSKIANKTVDDDADESVDGAEVSEEADNIHFEPIVQLPECVDLKTGEEDEQEMFRQRARVYRFENTEWKERGVGEMKMLKNKFTGSYRLLLRREQVHKVALNHLLTTDMKLQPLQTTEHAFCWFAYDYSDEEPRMDKFAIRFKTMELSLQFLKVFEECQKNLTNSPAKVTEPVSEGNERLEFFDDKQKASVAEAGDNSLTDLLFFKRATITYQDSVSAAQVKCMVEIEIHPPRNGVGARILMKKDKGENLLDHVVFAQDKITRLTKKPTLCELTVDGQPSKSFGILFSSKGAADELEKLYKELASNQSNLS